jgi:hypothetical protein
LLPGPGTVMDIVFGMQMHSCLVILCALVCLLIEVFFRRSQTTKGVWLARAPNVEPTTLVMDLEGTDGRERGEVSLSASCL